MLHLTPCEKPVTTPKNYTSEAVKKWLMVGAHAAIRDKAVSKTVVFWT
jgi:hypothetical protein